MKKKLGFLIIVCSLGILFPLITDAQRILGGISVGMNLTQLDGDEYYGFHKIGLNAGPMVILPFGKNKKWSVSMELLYSQKGSHHGGNTDSTTYNFKLDYLEIPVLVHFTDKKIISGGVGFSYGQLVNQKETFNNQPIDTSYYVQPITGLSKSDISVIADLQIRLWNRLWANLRYQYTIVSLREVQVTDPTNRANTWTRNQFNNVITIRLTWVFNQEVPGKIRKKTEE